MTPHNSKYRPLNSIFMECNSCCFGRCTSFGHWQSMGFRGQKRVWTVNLTLETTIEVKIFVQCSMQLTTFQLCSLSLIVLHSLYLHVLAPLSQTLNGSYHNGWMSVVNKSSPKLQAGFLPNFAGMVLI